MFEPHFFAVVGELRSGSTPTIAWTANIGGSVVEIATA